MTYLLFRKILKLYKLNIIFNILMFIFIFFASNILYSVSKVLTKNVVHLTLCSQEEKGAEKYVKAESFTWDIFTRLVEHLLNNRSEDLVQLIIPSV